MTYAVFRVANRTGLAVGNTPAEVGDRRCSERVPEEFLANAHHWLILHRPLCLPAAAVASRSCAVARWCDRRRACSEVPRRSLLSRPMANRLRKAWGDPAEADPPCSSLICCCPASFHRRSL